MQDFAMPESLNLEASRREGIPAIRREVIHNTTTQNEYRPTELCYIPLDTGAAGAFMDVKTTRLELTVVVRNKNFFIDFINLPRCGWHSLIQEFGIEINNGIHELNRHYAECVELEMIKLGQNKVPFLFTHSNPWKPSLGTAGKFHINFIKPSMVTAQGLPHNVQYPSLTTLTSATTPDTITQSMLLFSNPFLNESLGTTGSFTTTTINSGDLKPQDANWFAPSSFNIAQAYYDDRLPLWQDATTRASFVNTQNNVAITTDKYTSVGAINIADSNGYSNNRIKKTGTGSRIRGLPHGGAILSRYSKQTPYSNSENVYTRTLWAQNIYNCTYGQTVRQYPPSMWPAKQPCDMISLQKEIDENFNHVNGDNIMNYYANCKNIPVGIPLVVGTGSGDDKIWGDKIHTTSSDPQILTVGAETEFHISLKIYSSLIGELAKKWFPELVVPQGRMRVRLRFQEPQIVFQTLMDPCRRVPGTSRDWFPNLGITDTGGTQIQNISECSPDSITSGVHPIMVSSYVPGDVYIDAIATGSYPIPITRTKMLHDLFTAYDLGNHVAISDAVAANLQLGGGNTAIKRFGVDNYQKYPFDPNEGGGSISFIGASFNTNGWKTMAAAFSQYHYETRTNGEYGYPVYRTDFPTSFPPLGEHQGVYSNGPDLTKISQYWNYTHPEQWNLRYYRQTVPATDEVLSTSAARGMNAKSVLWYTEHDGSVSNDPQMKTAPFYDWDTKSLNWNPFCFPTPQYLPLINSDDKRSIRTLKPEDFADENQTCFGTHRESSVAQVRRTHSSLYPLQIPDSVSSRIDERLTYIVKNVQIVTQQVVMPRTAALSIIENALNGGISMETRAWKEMESMLPKQETQKALINMAAAFCTDITFLFRPIETFQGDRAFGYNSFSFYNPFTSFSYVFDATLTPNSSSERDYNYLGGRPIYYNECIIQQRTGFDIQLQLSAELLPRQPIDTIRRLIQHVRWGDQVFSDRDYMQLDPHLHPSYGTQKGMVINTLQDGFWACYVPISALDDQTITDNPFFTPAELTLKKRLRGKRAPIDALPFHKPFDGTFHLSFNLEAFMGHNEKIRTGVPIVNNNMFLKFDKAHMIRDYDTQLLTVVNCDARVVFERGGTMQFFT